MNPDKENREWRSFVFGLGENDKVFLNGKEIIVDMVKPGIQTTEYQISKAAGFMGNLGVILGGVVAFIPKIMELLGGVVDENSITYIVMGGVLATVSVIYKTLVDLGYINSRTEVKATANVLSAKKAEGPELEG